jgi:prolyl 4-hydroxylase
MFGLNHLLLYSIGSAEESNWRMHNPDGWKLLITNNFATGSTEAHHAAASGDIERLEAVLGAHAEAVNQQDTNGWAPIHEAARGGFTEVAKYLIERGADVNAKVKGGGTALHLARQHLGAEHPVVHFLQSIGAHDFGPEL